MASAPPPSRKNPSEELYFPGDRIPVPDAHERDTESAWAMFNALNEAPTSAFQQTAPVDLSTLGPAYARTEPSPLAPTAPQAPVARAARAVTVDEVLIEARRLNRVCPLPVHWVQLYNLLPGKKQTAHGWIPAPPITGAAWGATPAMPKRMCLRDHIEWAAAHGALEPVLAFLKSLPEDQWQHMGD